MSTEISANSLLTGSEAVRGQAAVERNAAAVKQIYESIRTSYGPLGLDKMCIDASGTVSITNDGATILKNMVVEDPAAKLLVNLSLEQDRGVGDGTTSVVLLAANLVLKGSQLIYDGIHPSVVVSGYRMAFNECVKYIKSAVARKLDEPERLLSGSSIVDSIIETSISSKIISQEAELFTEIAKKAILSVESNGKYDVDRINILKSLGGSLHDSEHYSGYILNCSLASRLMSKQLENPRIACLDFSLLREKLPLSASIRVTDPDKLEDIRKEEIAMTKKKCAAIIDSGANLVLTTGGMDELCIKMFVDNGVVAVRRCKREDLENIARAVGTEVKRSMVDEETSAYKLDGLGKCARYEAKVVSDYELVYLEGCGTALSTVLIRGPNSQVADEAERALNDALQVLKRTLESRSIVPGGGAVEVALTFLLEDLVLSTNCKEHVAIHRFSESLLELPRILASNAGLDTNLLISRLLKEQHSVYSSGHKNKFLGLDATTGTIQDNFERGIVEPTLYKLRVLKAATEAAISILRINEISTFPGRD